MSEPTMVERLRKRAQGWLTLTAISMYSRALHRDFDMESAAELERLQSENERLKAACMEHLRARVESDTHAVASLVKLTKDLQAIAQSAAKWEERASAAEAERDKALGVVRMWEAVIAEAGTVVFDRCVRFTPDGASSPISVRQINLSELPLVARLLSEGKT